MADPTRDQFETAALWLENYEGSADDSAKIACTKVAEWLTKKIKLMMIEERAQELSKQTGVPIGVVRQKLRETLKKVVAERKSGNPK